MEGRCHVDQPRTCTSLLAPTRPCQCENRGRSDSAHLAEPSAINCTGGPVVDIYKIESRPGVRRLLAITDFALPIRKDTTGNCGTSLRSRQYRKAFRWLAPLSRAHNSLQSGGKSYQLLVVRPRRRRCAFQANNYAIAKEHIEGDGTMTAGFYFRMRGPGDWYIFWRTRGRQFSGGNAMFTGKVRIEAKASVLPRYYA